MISKDLLRHGREFLRMIRNGHCEQTDTGIWFPRAKAMASGVYHDNDGLAGRNRMPIESLNYLLETGLNGGSAAPSFHLALFANNITPTDTWTANDFASVAGEIVSATEGYSEALRPEWVPAAASAGAMSNYADKVTFTIVTSNELEITGAALLSSAAKGSTAGVLISAAKFDRPRTKVNGEEYYLGYQVELEAV